MEKNFYQTKIEESFGNLYVKVSVDDSTFIGAVKSVIQSLRCIKQVDIKDCVDTKGVIYQTIYVFPDTGIFPCTVERLQNFEKRIHCALDEFNLSNGEIFKMRERISKSTNALKVYDKVIVKMVIGEYDQILIDDMCNLLGILSDDFTNVQVVSSIRQIEITDKKIIVSGNDIHEKIIKLFNAIRAAVLVNY